MQTINSQNLSLVNLLALIALQPNAVLRQPKQIVIRKPHLLLDAEVIIRSFTDERPVQLEEGDVALDRIVLSKTERGVSMGLQRLGDMPAEIAQAIGMAFQTARESVDWSDSNHAKGEYLGGDKDSIKDFDFYYGNTVVQLSGTMPAEPGKRNPLNAVHWEQITTPDGQIYFQLLTQQGQIFQAQQRLRDLQAETPNQVAQSLCFDQVILPKGVKAEVFRSFPHSKGAQPNLLVAAQGKAVYWSANGKTEQIANVQMVSLSTNVKTGVVSGISSDRGYYTAEVTGNTITPFQPHGDQLGDDWAPMFKAGSPRVITGPDLEGAFIGTIQQQGKTRYSFGRTLSVPSSTPRQAQPSVRA